MEKLGRYWDPVDYESITVSNVAKTLTASKYFTAGSGTTTGVELAQRAIVTVEDDEVRIRFDGTAPTSSEGHLLGVGDQVELDNIQELRSFQAIRVTTDAKLKVTYYKGGA